jgi:hypothetical protein
MYRKIVSSISIILGALLIVTSLLIMVKPEYTYAANWKLIGDEAGIKIDAVGPLFTADNMAPGDNLSSSIKVRNQGNYSFTFSVTTHKESGDDMMFEGLDMEITDGENTSLYRGKMNDLVQISMGSVSPGTERELVLIVSFPEESGNDYQGKSVSVKWTFVASRSYTPPSDPPGPPSGPTTEDPVDETDLDDNETPKGPTEPGDDEIIDVDDDIIPAGPGELPKTGEFPPAILHILGVLLIILGLSLKKTKIKTV